MCNSHANNLHVNLSSLAAGSHHTGEPGSVLTHPATLRLIHGKPPLAWHVRPVCECVHVIFNVFNLCNSWWYTHDSPRPLTTSRAKSAEYGLLWALKSCQKISQGRLVVRQRDQVNATSIHSAQQSLGKYNYLLPILAAPASDLLQGERQEKQFPGMDQ